MTKPSDLFRDFLDGIDNLQVQQTVAHAQAVADLKQKIAALTHERDSLAVELASVTESKDLTIRTLSAEIDKLRAELATTEQADPGLFFAFPEEDPKDRPLIFAHYFPVFPLTIDNQPQESDYYSKNWLHPKSASSGEQHSTYGGRLRDRPLSNAPYPGGDPAWRISAALEEVQVAKKYHLDGFFVNLMSTGHAKTYNALIEAAKAESFALIPMVDTNGSLSKNRGDLLNALRDFLNSGIAHKMANGKYAVGSFKAEGGDQAYWDSLKSDVFAQTGKEIDYLHVYNSGNVGNLSAYAAGVWGVGTDPVTVNAWSGTQSQTDAKGQNALYPVWPGDTRVKSGLADETQGLSGLTQYWKKVLEHNPEYVQLCTWDDLTEGSQFKPTAMRGTALLELSAYYMAQSRTGKAPKILKDAIFVAHRNQTLDAKVTGGQTVMMQQWRAPRAGRGSNVTNGFQDSVYVTTFLTRAQKVYVEIGGISYNYDAPAGEHTQHFPAVPGKVYVTCEFGAQLESPILIRSQVVNQDRAYAFTSNLGNAGLQYNPTPVWL